MSDPDSAASSPAPETRLARLHGVVHRTLRRALGVAGLSALSAGVLWWYVAGQFAAAGQLPWGLAGAVLVLLLVPAGGTWLAVHTVHGVMSLPEVLRGLLAESQTQATVVRTERGTTRAIGFVRLLWTLRGLATDTQGQAMAAMALFQASRLPLLLAALIAFLLNFVMILAGLVALSVGVF
ncbi:MAG: hypothetical protein AAGI71_16435 [Bacteroidota bacterium]